MRWKDTAVRHGRSKVFNVAGGAHEHAAAACACAKQARIFLPAEQPKTPPLTMRGSSSTATTLLAFSRSFMVRLPVPGPISSTTSVLLTPALSTMACTTIGFFKMCWPLDLWNSRPWGSLGDAWCCTEVEGGFQAERLRACAWCCGGALACCVPAWSEVGSARIPILFRCTRVNGLALAGGLSLLS